MKLKRIILAIWAISILSLMLLTAGLAQDAAPVAVVEKFQNELLSAMKAAERLRFRGRYKRLAPAVRESHDLPAITQIALGPYWNELSDTQAAKLVDAFTKLSIATYADRFDGYSGETFGTQSSEKLSPDVAAVHSVLTQSDGEEIRFDYLLRRDEDRWRIVNIVVDGVSDLALKRAEYSEILANEGFDALLARIKEKITESSESTD